EAAHRGQAALAAVHLADDLLVVDPLEQLTREVDAGLLAAVADLVEKAVGDELQALLDQLVVDLALALDLLGGLELRGQPRLQLAEAHVVQARRIHVIGRDATPGEMGELDRAIDGPVRGLRGVHRHEDSPVHEPSRGRKEDAEKPAQYAFRPRAGQLATGSQCRLRRRAPGTMFWPRIPGRRPQSAPPPGGLNHALAALV